MSIRAFILCAILLPLIPYSTTSAEEGYFGENPGLDFYSMVDDGSQKIAKGITQTRLREYSTFRGFGRACRSPAPWFDATPMSEQLLEEVSGGYYHKILTIASQKNITLTSESLMNLSQCLSETYNEIKSSASYEQNVLERLGSLGLYMDGDSGNSDYDIVADIQKINKIIFTEDEPYKGRKNSTKSSLGDLLSGKPLRSLFGNGPTNTGTGENTGNSSSGTENGGNTHMSGGTIGIGSICSASISSSTDIDNLINSDFLSELSDTLTDGTDTHGNDGNDYGNPHEPSSESGSQNNPSPDSSSDFFDEIPCDNIFCIKIRMVSGNQNLLGGGKKDTIEGIIDKHIEIMWPIADTNLAGQKMTNNSFQLSWTNFKFEKLIPKPLIYISYAPQKERKDKKYDTKESKDERLRAAYKCAMYDVGLPNDPNMANSTIGASYAVNSATTPTNIDNTKRELGPSDPEQKNLNGCFDVALSEGRKTYYNSFSTDLTEISAFTAAMIAEISDILQSGTKLDTLPAR